MFPCVRRKNDAQRFDSVGDCEVHYWKAWGPYSSTADVYVALLWDSAGKISHEATHLWVCSKIACVYGSNTRRSPGPKACTSTMA